MRLVPLFCFWSSFIFIVVSVQSEPICHEGFFYSSQQDRCLPCTRCQWKYGALHRCSPYRDTVCKECEYGVTFSRSRSYKFGCLSCNTCPNQHIVRPCRQDRNTQCGACLDGFYKDNLTNRCERCSPCLWYSTVRMQECNVPSVPVNRQCASLLRSHDFQ